MKVKTVTNGVGDVFVLKTDILRVLQRDLIKKLKAGVSTEYVEELISRFEQLGDGDE
jgi:hypothetical protein